MYWNLRSVVEGDSEVERRVTRYVIFTNIPISDEVGEYEEILLTFTVAAWCYSQSTIDRIRHSRRREDDGHPRVEDSARKCST